MHPAHEKEHVSSCVRLAFPPGPQVTHVGWQAGGQSETRRILIQRSWVNKSASLGEGCRLPVTPAVGRAVPDITLSCDSSGVPVQAVDYVGAQSRAGISVSLWPGQARSVSMDGVVA